MDQTGLALIFEELFMKKIILIALLLSNSLSAATYEIKKSPEHVSFIAKGKPSFISIKGVGEGLSGSVVREGDIVSGELIFNLDTLSTGIDLRDDHLKNTYLQVKEHPQAKLTLSEGLTKINDEEVNFKGRLLLHGVEREVSGVGTLSDQELMAEFAINLSDFNIAIPSFQGITVAEKVTIKVNTKVEKRP